MKWKGFERIFASMVKSKPNQNLSFGLCFEKQSLQNTGLPAVGLNGTWVF